MYWLVVDQQRNVDQRVHKVVQVAHVIRDLRRLRVERFELFLVQRADAVDRGGERGVVEKRARAQRVVELDQQNLRT